VNGQEYLQANVLDNVGDMCRRQKLYDEATAAFDRALKIR